MSDDARIRVRYLQETIRLLFPGSLGEGTAYSLVPHARLPRRLVRRAWWHRPLFGRPILVPHGGDDSIESHLTEVLGLPIRVIPLVRPARRANRKPVLVAYGPSGPVAYIKIGDTEGTARLVRHEARTLTALAHVALKVVIAPTVLHHGRWNDLEVLALTPLPARRGQAPSEDLVRAAVREIAGLGPDGGHAWHGDFTPWNMARGDDGRLLVWDWERFGTGVPFGFDAAHLYLHRTLRWMTPVDATRACVAHAAATLEPYGMSTAEAKRTVLHHLITIANRHAADGHEPFGPPSRWLSPLIDHEELIL